MWESFTFNLNLGTLLLVSTMFSAAEIEMYELKEYLLTTAVST